MSSDMITFWNWAIVAAVALPVLLGLYSEWSDERVRRKLPTTRR